MPRASSFTAFLCHWSSALQPGECRPVTRRYNPANTAGSSSSITTSFFGHLETRCADRIALLHVHVLEALINLPSRRDRSTFRPKISSVSPLVVRTSTFFTKNSCFNFCSRSSPEREREKFIVKVHTLKESVLVSCKKSIVDVAGFESKVFRCLGHTVFPGSW